MPSKILRLCIDHYKKIVEKVTLISIFVDQGIVSGGNFVLGILAARFLGVELYGNFALLWLIVIFLNSLQIAFIISPMLNFSSKKKNLSLDIYLNSLFRLQFFLSLILAIGLLIFLEFAFLFDPKWNLGDSKYLIILVSVIFLNQDFIRRYFIIKKLQLNLLVIDLIAYFGQTFFIIAFFYFNVLDLNYIFYSIIISFGISLTVGLFKFHFLQSNFRYLKILFLKNWGYSKWLVYSSFLQWGSGNYYHIAAGAILGSWAVGAVKIIQNLMGVLNVIFLALENILPINYAKIFFSTGLDKLTVVLKRDIYYGVGAFIILFGISLLYGDKIIYLIYGASYIQYANLLNWFILIYFFIYIGNLFRISLRVLDNTKFIFLGYIVNLIITFFSASLIINSLGITGVAIGILITQMVMLIILTSSYINVKNRVNENYSCSKG